MYCSAGISILHAKHLSMRLMCFLPLAIMLAAAPTQAQPNLAQQILAAHNLERGRWRLAPLQWDPALAASAKSYGPTLSRLGRLEHSPRTARAGQGENLWMGTRGAFSPEQMVGGWLSERNEFRPGIFPNVSRTGNWFDVGHYSQILWPTTTRLGCAIQSSRSWDFLICRYSPAGNMDGRRVP